jgi:hypothetical protein
VLYQITQDQRMSQQLGSTLDLLRETLSAHRLALSIDMQNADVLFNTAQVLTTIAEELTESDPVEADDKAQATSLLQEAVELFSACLTRQEMEFTDHKSMQDAATDVAADDDEMVDETQTEQAESSSDETPEQWATVIEPVTATTLLDTAVAQLNSLSTLASVVAPTGSSALATITELATPLISQKLPYYISLIPEVTSTNEPTPSTAFLSISSSTSSFHANKEAQTEAANPRIEANMDAQLAVAKFTAAMADAEFRSNLIDIPTYHDKIVTAYESNISKQSADLAVIDEPRILCEYADSWITFSHTLTEVDGTQAQSFKWQALTSAEALLGRAIKAIRSNPTIIPEGSSNSKLYIQRGDIEMQRWRLATLPSAAKGIASGAPTLLKNSGVYYRGAKGFADRDGDHETATEGGVKAGIVEVIEKVVNGVAVDAKEIIDRYSFEVVNSIVEDVITEGLVDNSIMSIFGKL